MSEADKKASTWPWIVVPLAAVSLFFVLRECQHRLPPAAATPAATAPAESAPAAETTPPPPAPQ